MNAGRSKKLLEIYNSLLEKFGRQKWWPIANRSKNRQDNQFEICIGAILTQNTSWSNVEKALFNLNQSELLNEERLRGLEVKKLAMLIRPAGYYNKKAEKLKAFLSFIEKNPLEKLESMPLEEARKLLLEVHGIGNETADSMLLYAFNKPIFVIDAYTKKVFNRIFNLSLERYEEWQKLFMENLPHKADLFNEYHALIVEFAKRNCRKNPLCEECILKANCHYKNKLY